MKARHHYSNSQMLRHGTAHSYSRPVLALIVVLLLFFLLPGLLAAQETGDEAQTTQLPVVEGEDAGGEEGTPGLNQQAVAAAVVAAQPGSSDQTPDSQTLSRELRTDRLWLLPRHSAFTDMIRRAGRQALQHPDCNEVLYGSLNEFRSERTGTSFTILCMKDARTTFNQVFFADDLLSEEELNAIEPPASSVDELERLRQMMSPQTAPNTTQPAEPDAEPANLPAPIVF